MDKINHIPEHFGIRVGAEKFPLMVVVSFSYVCNSRCPNCPYNNSTIRNTYKDAMFIPEDIFKKIADECGKYSAFIRLSGGGEPMLHPKVVELISYAKEIGAKIGLITNGSNFDESSIEELLNVGTDVIEFSVDAENEKTYSIVRPKLSWKNLVETVKRIRLIRDMKHSSTKLIASIINQVGVDVVAAERFWQPLVDNVQIRKYLTWGYNKDLISRFYSLLGPV